jgi:hypothetical protein
VGFGAVERCYAPSPSLFPFPFRASCLVPVLLLLLLFSCYYFPAGRSVRVDPPSRSSSGCFFAVVAVVRLARSPSAPVHDLRLCERDKSAVGFDIPLFELVLSSFGTYVGFCTCISYRTIEL